LSGQPELEHIEITRAGRVIVATIDRDGDPLNRIDEAVHDSLCALFTWLRTERSARAVLINARGDAFSAGGDFAWLPSLADPKRRERLRLDARQLIWDLLDIHLPVVCAISGPAVGLGASIALLCDVIVMAESATLADPHVSIGLVAGDGGTISWPLAVGPAVAKRHLLTGDPISAAKAERLGLVTDVVEDDRLDEHSAALANRLADGAPLAIQHTKAAINSWIKQQAASAFDQAIAAETITLASNDHREALEAISDKRAPRFEGS
jgi:enoyl-CoA hydratase